MIGGLGVAGGMNVGTDAAVFEATHGSSPTYAGSDRMNPTALMLSGVYMLDHLGEHVAARALEDAIATVIRTGDKVTYDLKASRTDPTAVGTSQFADAVIEEMNA
jgi:isocitrate dehydrogenase (NAD+)